MGMMGLGDEAIEKEDAGTVRKEENQGEERGQTDETEQSFSKYGGVVFGSTEVAGTGEAVALKGGGERRKSKEKEQQPKKTVEVEAKTVGAKTIPQTHLL